MSKALPAERTDLICPDCGAPMKLRPSRYGLFYGCSRFPMCKGTHGAHPDGRPLGVPANRETKDARIRAHAVFDAIWKNAPSEQPKKRRRGRAYVWLAKRMGVAEVHMGEMTIEECERVVAICTNVVWDDARGPIPLVPMCEKCGKGWWCEVCKEGKCFCPGHDCMPKRPVPNLPATEDLPYGDGYGSSE